MELMRSLLETSERERASLRQTLDDVLSFQQLAEAVGDAADFQSMAVAMASTFARVLPWSAITIRVGDGNCRTRELYSQGMGPQALLRFRELEDDAVVRWAMESLRPTAIPSMDGPGGPGWIVVPLVVQRRTVGLVALIPSTDSATIGTHQMDMLRLIGTQAAAAIDNMEHMAGMRRNWAELHSLYEVASTLGKSLEVEHLFETTSQAILDRCQPKVVALGFVEPSLRAIRIFASGAQPEDCRILLDLGLVSQEVSILDANLSHGQDLSSLGAGAAFVVPLVASGRHLGALLVAHESTEFVASKDVRHWIAALARLLSASLENARLYEELMASNRRMSEMQSRMIQAGRLAGIGQLAGGIAHEINNPLQVILGRVQILQMRCEGQSQVITDLGRLEAETMRIAQIVRGMQEFARQQGEVVERRPVPISVIAEAVLELVGFRLKRHRIELVREGFESAPVVMCDQDELKHLVLNICQNAIHAMSSGGTMVVRLAEREGQAVLEISDTGAGIPPEDLDRIFDPFFSRRSEGMGMGLAIGYAIAQRHGGSLYAVPGISEGAILRVVLPLHTGGTRTESVILPG